MLGYYQCRFVNDAYDFRPTLRRRPYEIEQWRIIGAPITVKGVGAHGSDLNTTIASVVNSKTLTLRDAAAAPGEICLEPTSTRSPRHGT